VRYEQLARHPEAEMRRVLAFLGEPWCPDVLEPSADASNGTRGGGNHHKAVFTSSHRPLEDGALAATRSRASRPSRATR